MSARRNALYAGLLVAGVSAALSGCAVLRIDVDVYKGPLANEESVQMEQFAAMAIGAKPLLIALRDRLQWRDDGVRGCARGRGWYKAGFFPEPNLVERDSQSDSEEQKLGCRYGKPVPWNESAGRVNAVLSLYEDLDNPGLEKFVAEGKVAFEQYQSAVKVLTPVADKDKAFWGSIESGFKPDPINASGKLKAALKGLLYPDSLRRQIARYSKTGPHVEFMGVFNASESAPGISAVRRGNFGTYGESEELGQVGELDLLSWPPNLNGIASLLFKPKPEAEKEIQKFKSRVEELAGAYFDAREAMQSMLSTGLRALKFLNSPDFEGKDRLRLSDITVGVLLELMQPQHVALAIHLPTYEDVTSDKYPALFELRAMLTEGEGGEFWEKKALKCDKDTGNCWKPERFADAKRIIGRALFLDPIKVVDLLMKVDEILRDDPPGKWAGTRLDLADPPLKSCQTERNLRNCQSVKELEQFGLARGPSLDANILIRKNISEAAGQLAEGAAVGFEGGRLPVGIETLIVDYLQKTADHPLANTRDEVADERERAKVRLRKALVRFSEKVLFIANNDKLLSDDREKINRYILVLQAVGNSILIQADELRNRAEFNRDLEYRESPEIWAQEQGAKEWPDQPYRAWLKEVKLDGAAGTGNRSQREVLDDLIALLRYEYITAVKTNGKTSTEAKNTLDALAVAYEQRAGMAYIRPSGAYLRSSYPATSLQDDPRLGWTNMLSDHGLRTTPIIGSLYNLATEDRTKAEINAEIDKQFWQTINSVRVSGAGRTNYVVVKDDVGNWYVKKYSADPESIIKSAKSLALFSMGGQFDPDLAAKALEKDGLGKLEDSARVPVPPALQFAFDEQRNTYTNATGGIYEALRTLLEDPGFSALATNIMTSWERNELTTEFLEDLENALVLAVGETLQPASAELGEVEAGMDADGVKRAKWIVGALARIKMFQETLQSNVGDQKIVAKAERDRDALEERKTDAESKWQAAVAAREAAEGDASRADELDGLRQEERDEKATFDSLSDDVDEAKVKVENAKLAEPTAVKTATEIVQRLLLKKIKSRLEALNAYEQRILVLGEMNPQ